MKTITLLGAAVAALSPVAAWAQEDHSQHQGHGTHTPVATPAPSTPLPPAPPPPAPPAPDHSQHQGHDMDGHPPMDHSKMDHSTMDHSKMGHDMDMGDADAPYGTGSGTSRVPGAEGDGHSGVHIPTGGNWMLMAHGFANTVYTDQTGPRGDDKLYVQSMLGLMAEQNTDWGRLQFKGMFSLEPLMSNRGYPNLFSTGETAGGLPLVDRQHPHDFTMELSARVDVNIAKDTSLFLYGGPVGEPAIGPAAFMHRGSARYNPEAPITHHWFDSTHITYGVATLGVAAPHWQVEGSVFTGREPDEDRWAIDKMRFDSWSMRATLTPSLNWAMQVSYGKFKEPEPTHPGVDTGKFTASVNYANGKGLSAMLAFGARDNIPGDTSHAWLGEINWDLNDHHTLFGRIENVENEELFPDHDDPLHDQTFRVTKFQAGYAYRLPITDDLGLALGGTVAAFDKPSLLDSVYGRNPMGYTLFAKLSLGQ